MIREDKIIKELKIENTIYRLIVNDAFLSINKDNTMLIKVLKIKNSVKSVLFFKTIIIDPTIKKCRKKILRKELKEFNTLINEIKKGVDMTNKYRDKIYNYQDNNDNYEIIWKDNV